MHCRVAHLNTLGVAQYRASQFTQALATLNKSRRLNSAGADAAEDVAFLAMAQFQLGRQNEARRSLKQLRNALKTSPPDSASARFINEAGALVGE